MKGFSLKQNWWKIVCVVLLTYTITAGLCIPLAPGVTVVNPSVLSTAETFSLRVSGYHTHFKSDNASLQAWLYNGNQKVCALSAVAQDETTADLVFAPNLPLADSTRSMDLIVRTNADGNMYVPNAVTSTDTVLAEVIQTCTPQFTNAKAQRFGFPFRHILYESVRNLFFHVPMWFTMIALFSWGVFSNIRYLRSFDLKHDKRASEAVNTGLAFAIFGLITGAIWARVTWGAWWPNDVKLNGSAITVLAYLAFIVLRNAIDDEHKRARISAVYSIFAYVMMLVLIGILPRLTATDSLHPGNGGNPAFSSYDLDNSLRAVFYTAVLGWIMLGFWIYQLRLRMRHITDKLADLES